MTLKALTLAVFAAAILFAFASADATTPPSTTSTNSTSTTSFKNVTHVPKNKTYQTSTAAFEMGMSNRTTASPTKKEEKQTKSKKAVTKSKTTKQATTMRKTTHWHDSTSKTGKPTGKRKNTGTTPKAKPSATPKPEISCEMRNESCSKCVDDSSCVYCDSDDSCRKKKGSVLPSGCSGNKWFWKQCTISGNILIIVIPTVGGVLLIMLGCCIYCCCCRRRGRNRAAQEERRQRQRRLDRDQRNAERKQNRKDRHDAIRMKYGLLQNDDDDDDDAIA